MEARRKVYAQVEASMEARREVWIEERSRAWVEIEGGREQSTASKGSMEKLKAFALNFN